MDELKDFLSTNVKAEKGDESTAWESFMGQLQKGIDLETALHTAQLTEQLEAKVIKQTHSLILSEDQKVFRSVLQEKTSFPLTRLIRHLARTTHPTISIVTTNYDRIAEYASDAAEIAHTTGFSHGYLRRFHSINEYAGVTGLSKVVEILKVHGSIDWFIDPQGNAMALPDSADIPSSFSPLLVTPGTGKYAATHEEPFRSIITR